MSVLASISSGIRNDQHCPTTRLKKAEGAMFDAVRESLTRARVTRADALEQAFDRAYGSVGVSAESHSANANQKMS